MSWNILPKNVLQYFLEKLKTKFLLSKSNDILGSKNILPFPYTYGSGTVQGLTVTVHEDGSITAQGTPTQDIAFPLNANLIEDLNLSAGDELIFSEWEVQNQNAFAALLSNGTPISEVRGDYKLTITSELVQNGVAFILFFVRGVDLTTPVTFKPMIRLTTDTDHTWHSPALTNKTLTDRVIYLNHRIEEVNAKLTIENISLTNVTWNKTINGSYTWFEKMGNTVSFQIYITESFSGNFTLASNLPTNIRPSKQKWFAITGAMGGNITARLNILTDGNIGVLSGSTALGNAFVSGTYFL